MYLIIFQMGTKHFIQSMSYVLKSLTTMPVTYTGEISSIRGFQYKAHCRNHVFFFISIQLICKLHSQNERWERKKELGELIRKIHSLVEQLQHCLLDKGLLILHCFPLVSVLLHTPGKMYLATLTKLPLSSNIFSLYCAYL